MKHSNPKSLIAAMVAAAACLGAVPAQAGEQPSAERGRYLAQIAGCNDCHTAGYMEAGGRIPESEWLTGDTVGWNGPWGTTYAPNLRLYMQGLDEDQWVVIARNLQVRPPMPWFNLNAFDENDLRSFYRYVRALGAGGQPAPSYLPPDREPPKPYFTFVNGSGS